ncbi:MAG TPA: VOC family protein [Caulobacteraceae bacterium]
MTGPVFHLSIPVSDLARSLSFYETLGGERGRLHDDWADIWLFGGQITLFLDAGLAAVAPSLGRTHFGGTLGKGDWDALVARVAGQGLAAVRGPVSEPAPGGFQHKLYLRDPDGWTVEIKSYDDAAAALERAL